MERLPSFERSEASPEAPAAGIALAVEVGATPRQTIVRGSWRVPDGWPADAPPLEAIWLLAIGRRSRLAWQGQPGGEALSFAGDDSRRGWFHVSLGECCRLPARFAGQLDVTAVLGEWKSNTLELEFAAPDES